MTTEHAGGRRGAPVRISHMKIAPADPRQPADAPLVIVAEFDPGPGGEEHLWWIAQLQGRVKVLGGTGSPRGGTTAIRVEAPRDQVEAVARRLLTAVEEVNAAYPEGYAAWRREQDERIAGQRLEEQRRAAAPQAIAGQGDGRVPLRSVDRSQHASRAHRSCDRYRVRVS